MEILIDVMIAVSLLVVLGFMGLGLFSLARGGDFNTRWGNRLMRYRVMSQAVAYGALFIGFAYKLSH